ncbi:MAG: Gfo/Idh/MocA family oxidoreductase [Chloroflexi bacterium]|nr:Gfo/Idh/MocA family oxidoreductase [Chloroflexota bacterium]
MPTELRPLVPDPHAPLGIALYGVQHSHAAGKARALAANPDVKFCAVCEPEPQARARAQDNPAFASVRWFDSSETMLSDPSVVAVAVEGAEGGCIALARQCIEAGKHIWYDKPAGDWPGFQSVVATARERGLLIQMGYMLRYNTAFECVSDWTRSGLLGEIFAVRGHMSTSSPEAARGRGDYRGGIAFQLAPHMIDQAVWLFGSRPRKVTAYLRNDATSAVPQHADNTLAVLEFDRGMAYIDIAHMEPSPPARRFEVYGTRGSAIIVEPFEPGHTVRLCLVEAQRGLVRGEQYVRVDPTPRPVAYERELAAFVATLRGRRPPDRTLDHELLVEETLHRVTGSVA